MMARQWMCGPCGFIYDESAGLPNDGIAPGTAFEDISDDWACPDCGLSKADFFLIPDQSPKSHQEKNMTINASSDRQTTLDANGIHLSYQCPNHPHNTVSRDFSLNLPNEKP